MKAIIKKHPELDFFIGMMGGPEIPTKQDKFKLLDKEIYHKDGDEFIKIEEDDLYLKKQGKDSLQVFEKNLREIIKEQVTEAMPYASEIKLEVIVSVSMKEKRLKVVDMDNLLKSVLDCLNGLVYTDDSQIVNLYGSKEVNEAIPLNSLMIGIRKLNDNYSWFEKIKLAYIEYEE